MTLSNGRTVELIRLGTGVFEPAMSDGTPMKPWERGEYLRILEAERTATIRQLVQPLSPEAHS